MLTPTTIAIPLYFLLIGIELIINQFQQQKRYRLNDAITNINIGASQQVVAVIMRIIGIGLYEVVFQYFSFRWIDTQNFSWVNFILLFIAWDFCYYWAHRMSHEINLFWSGHVVHHQSEEYNLSVALRQSWFQAVWTAPFYLPLALIGFDPMDVVFASGINLIYQFWIHTEVINKMGILEWVMNTPSHHRVHHGRNPKYIDKNHAGVFIIWDRMFGTFQKEDERPVYGITTPLNSFNPLWSNVAHFKTIGEQLREAPNFIDKLKILFCKPGWSAKLQGYIPIPEVSETTIEKYNPQVPLSINLYVIFQYILTMVGTAAFLFQVDNLNLTQKIISATLVVWVVVAIGGLLEGKRWVFFSEFARILLTYILTAILIYPLNDWWVEVLALISLIWCITFKDFFLKRSFKIPSKT